MFKTGGIAIVNKHLKGKPPLKIPLTKENSFLVFPFDLNAGYITSTENGLRQNDNLEIEDYSNFQRIFTGLESMLAQWQGAYDVRKETDNATKLTKTYKVGRQIKGFISSETMSASFEPSTISGDFLAEFTDESFRVHTYEELEEKDLFRLFIIPQLHQNKWLYVESATNYYWNKKYHHTEITLQTLNNKIAKSGASVESFVQRGSAGEGYAWPLIGADDKVSVDPIRSRDVPITSMQVELSGAGAINTFIAYGRPTKTKKTGGITTTEFNPDIEAPRLLLPLRIETPIPSPENTRPSAETDYYVGNLTPTLSDNYQDWKQQFSASFDLSQRSQYEGVLTGGKIADLRQSNPIAGGGTHSHIMWDSKWNIPIVNEERDTRPNNMTGEKITLNGNYTLSQLLAHQFFITSHITTLPLSVQQNIPWTASSLPLIGGFLQKLTLGIPFGWNEIAYRYQMGSVKLMIPASVAEYGNQMKSKANDEVWIPLETFTGQRKDEATEFSGINSTGTILKVALTHLFTKDVGGQIYTFDTKDLGQDMPAQDAQGTAIPSPKGKLLWDKTCIPTSRGNVPGYVIDAPHFKAIAKMDYRLTFFSNDYQVWTGTYQTKGKFTGNIRDWTNTMKLSNWKETDGKTISYPKEIVAPDPPDTNYSNFIIDASKGQFDIDILQLLKDTALAVPTGNRYAETQFKRQQKVAVPKVVYEQEIDLAPYGGTTEIKNNYETISVVEPDGDEGFIDVDVDAFITAGSIDVLTRLYSGFFTIKVPYGETGGNVRTLILTLSLILKAKMVIVGDKMQYQITAEPFIEEVNGDNPIRLQNGLGGTDGVSFTGLTKQTTYTFDGLYFIGKKI